MQIDVHDSKKMVCVWLTREESADEVLKEQLKPLYAECKQKKYTVAVYQSGKEDLPDLTSVLLKYNRRLTAEREVKAEKLEMAR